MRKSFVFICVIALSFLSSSGLTLAQKEKTKDTDHGGRPFSVQLTGGAEVPGPGDSDGSGTAKLTLNHGKSEICYELSVKNIQAATLAHIHAGAAGQAGDVKVTLDPPANGTSKGCAAADQALIKDIMQNPGNYYVNIHNAEFPKGALRGQLGK